MGKLIDAVGFAAFTALNRGECNRRVGYGEFADSSAVRSGNHFASGGPVGKSYLKGSS